MDIISLFTRLKQEGIKVYLENENVKVNAPKGKLTPGILTLIKENKGEIIKFLKEFSQKKEAPAIVEPTEKKEYYPLSQNQRRMYFLYSMQPTGSAYNISGFIKLDEEVEELPVRRALQYIIRKHEGLRTFFCMIEGEPSQVIAPEVEVPLEMVDLSGLDETAKRNERDHVFQRVSAQPFDLSKAPLFRVCLVRLDRQVYHMIFNLHHIISDGWSLEVLKNDFQRLYREYCQGNEPGFVPMELQYRDFAAWHNRYIASTQGEKSYRFWKEKLAGDAFTFTLPADNYMNINDCSGAAFVAMVGEDTLLRLKKLAENRRVTLFSILLTVYLYLISRIAGKKEVVCSIITAGRDQITFQDVIGFFVNSMIFIARVESSRSFVDIVDDIHNGFLDTLQHQDYPLETIFRESGRRYPQIPTSINMINLGEAVSNTKLEPFQPHYEEIYIDVKFDLELYINECSNGIHFYWTYKKNMYQRQTILFFVEKYIRQLDFFSKDPRLSLNDYRREEKKTTGQNVVKTHKITRKINRK